MHKKTLLGLIAIPMTLSALFGLAACGEDKKDSGDGGDLQTHAHSMTHHEATVSCTEAGNIEYWSCSKCGKNFSDEAGEHEVTNLVVSALGHVYEGSYQCVNCNNELEVTNGLEYELNDDGKSYSVIGFGESTTFDIVIPYTHEGKPVTGIGDCAFSEAATEESYLKSIIIPDSVTSMGLQIFSDCNELASITVTKGNPRYHSDGNCIIETESKTLIFGCKNSIIPNDGSVTSIGDWAFDICRGLKSLTIPDSVTSIGESAFNYCTSLQSMTIPNSVTSIGEGAFSACCSLKTISIPSSITEISDGMFQDCLELTSITLPDSITRIGISAFVTCNELTSIAIPANVTSIGEYAFAECVGLTSITIPEKVASIGSGVFTECSELTSVIVAKGNKIYHSSGNCIIETESKTLIAGCKNSVIPTDGSVTGIGKLAFAWCDLTSVTIPNGVTSIGESAFQGCCLTSITIPDSVTSIGARAFSGCSMTSVTIPDSVTNIGTQAFTWCNKLTSVTIGNGVSYIGNSAFEGCGSLSSVTFENPNGWKADGKSLDVNDSQTAAAYLRNTYRGYVWTRS